MYHYVKESAKGFPFFRYLSLKNFKKQLDFFEKNYGFVRFDEFCLLKKEPDFFSHLKGKILLTFDDGLKEHFSLVFPELKRRGIFGIFFIPTLVLERKRALAVHTVHYLLGKMGGG